MVEMKRLRESTAVQPTFVTVTKEMVPPLAILVIALLAMLCTLLIFFRFWHR
jgi:hypothetical protein